MLCSSKLPPETFPVSPQSIPHLLHQTAVLMGTPLPGSAAASAGEHLASVAPQHVQANMDTCILLQCETMRPPA